MLWMRVIPTYLCASQRRSLRSVVLRIIARGTVAVSFQNIEFTPGMNVSWLFIVDLVHSFRLCKFPEQVSGETPSSIRYLVILIVFLSNVSSPTDPKSSSWSNDVRRLLLFFSFFSIFLSLALPVSVSPVSVSLSLPPYSTFMCVECHHLLFMRASICLVYLCCVCLGSSPSDLTHIHPPAHQRRSDH